VLGKPFWQTSWWTHDDDQARRLREGIAHAAAGEFVRFEATHRDRDGRIRFIDFSLSPVRDARNHVVQIIPEGRDLTALQEARDRAARLALQLQQAQKMEAIGRLAGSVAHDFNNLLIVLSGSIGLAREKLPPDSEAMPLLDESLQATATATSITRQLLTFGRRQRSTPRKLDVAAALGEIEGILRRLAGAGADLEIRVRPDLGAIYLDPTQLQQVLINLVVNARDAAPEGGTITIDAENIELGAEAAAGIADGRPGAFVRVVVRDTGRGMTEDVRSRIFEPFFTTKPDSGGTGLGLAVVHGIVHQAGGFVDVASEPGRGSTFVLYFPREIEP
jgi:signal transduction histidine kinase